jgi:glycine dehydrogenase subunit 1
MFTEGHDGDARAMLAALGLSSCGDLFESLPMGARLERAPTFAGPYSEYELARHMRGLAGRNLSAEDGACFAGGGIYDRFRPSIVDWVIQRGEFLTSYTSYQPEISQGFLTAMYEFQTLVCELYAMDVANASVYDAATGLAEAVLVAMQATKRRRAVLLGPLNPAYERCVRTSMASGLGAELVAVPHRQGAADLEALSAATDAATACVVVQQPSFLGYIEDVGAVGAITKAAGAKLIVCADPVAAGLLEPPGALGADIVVGEGQGLGLPMGYGGPGVGLLAAREELLRLLPGRIVGRTTDTEGRMGFVLTLQTREQHIRREKAASNICSNQGLCALAATVYLSAMGPGGLRRVAEMTTVRAHELRDAIVGTGLESLYAGPFFQEFAVRSPIPVPELQSELGKRGYILGEAIDGVTGVPNSVLLCATEQRTLEDIRGFARAVKEVLAHA